jgi:hypothetical protein
MVKRLRARGAAAKAASKSSRSGRFVTKVHAARSPRTTTTERVGSGTANNRTVTRSGTTGRFVTTSPGDQNPAGAVTSRTRTTPSKEPSGTLQSRYETNRRAAARVYVKAARQGDRPVPERIRKLAGEA